jgi:hypothetical protein
MYLSGEFYRKRMSDERETSYQCCGSRSGSVGSIYFWTFLDTDPDPLSQRYGSGSGSINPTYRLVSAVTVQRYMKPRRSRRPRCLCFRPSGFIEPITSDSEILKKNNRLQKSFLFVYQCCRIQGNVAQHC